MKTDTIIPVLRVYTELVFLVITAFKLKYGATRAGGARQNDRGRQRFLHHLRYALAT